MGVLSFDAVDDRLRWTSLASALGNVSDGAWTCVALIKTGAANSGWDAVSYLNSGGPGNTSEAGFSIDGSAECPYPDIGYTGHCATSALSATTVYLVSVRRASGTVVANGAHKQGSGGSWSHGNTTSTNGNQTAANTLDIGALNGSSDRFLGHIGLVAWWEGQLSQAQIEECGANWQTSDIWNNSFGQPQFLVELNVAAGSVTDLAGNASSLSATGTTLDAGETLDSWNFDGTGGGGGATRFTNRLILGGVS